MLPFWATVSKQHSTLLPQTATVSNDSVVKFRFFDKVECCFDIVAVFWQQCCRFRQQCRTKFRTFDKVETNWTCSICFDFVKVKLNRHVNYLGQWSFSSKVVFWKDRQTDAHIHAHILDPLLYLDQWNGRQWRVLQYEYSFLSIAHVFVCLSRFSADPAKPRVGRGQVRVCGRECSGRGLLVWSQSLRPRQVSAVVKHDVSQTTASFWLYSED